MTLRIFEGHAQLWKRGWVAGRAGEVCLRLWVQKRHQTVVGGRGQKKQESRDLNAPITPPH